MEEFIPYHHNPKLSDILSPNDYVERWTTVGDYMSPLVKFTLRKSRPRFEGISRRLDRRPGLVRNILKLFGGKNV